MNLLITQTNDLLNNQGFQYAFCGGFAVDLFLGCESRPHGDINILAYWKDRNKIIEYNTTIPSERKRKYESCVTKPN